MPIATRPLVSLSLSFQQICLLSQVEQIVEQTQQKCLAECKKQLEDSATQAVYTTDKSFSKYVKMRQA